MKISRVRGAWDHEFSYSLKICIRALTLNMPDRQRIAIGRPHPWMNNFYGCPVIFQRNESDRAVEMIP